MEFLSAKLDALLTLIVSVEMLWKEKYEIVCTIFVLAGCVVL